MNYFCCETIIGDIAICANKKAITKLCFGECSCVDAENVETEIIQKAFAQLKEYLDGSRKRFDLKLEYSGSDFQMSVWDKLKRI